MRSSRSLLEIGAESFYRRGAEALRGVCFGIFSELNEYFAVPLYLGGKKTPSAPLR
jgi:hypothetical protein